jgi:arylsulfatase A-like enzyme
VRFLRLPAISLATAISLAAASAIGAVTSSADARAQGAPAPRAEHVVLVAWDGFDAKYLERGVPTPNLDSLARRGSLTTSRGVVSSITNPSWSSVATGAFPERTLNAAYWYDPSADMVRGQSRAVAVETLGQSLRSAGRTLASVQWFIEQDKSVFYGNPEALYTQPGGSCDIRTDRAIDLLAGKPIDSGGQQVTVPKTPDFLGVYCSDLDDNGHKFGADAPIIDATLASLDKQLGRLVQATKDVNIYGRTLFVLTGDHGMTTFDKAFGNEILAAIDRAGYQGEFVGTNGKPAAGTDVVLAVGGMASAHLRGDALADPRAARRIEREIEKIPQVSQVLDKREQVALRMSPSMGELVIEPEEGWTAGPTAPAAPAGLHGTTHETAVPLLLSGAGVTPGHAPRRPRHVDIAPTIAFVLGERPPSGAQGRVLMEALKRP